MNKRISGLALLAMAAALSVPGAEQPRPCDIYGAAGTPCVAAHSTTRALYSAFRGRLYQVKRQADGKTIDIGVTAGGYADAGAQDSFCANALCVINVIYDQSPKGNHLYQGSPGPLFPGPAKGAFDTQPIADMAPITIGGRKAYGVYIMPGMGFRNNDASDIPVNDDPEGIYYVVDGKHFDSGCCFDYGNSSTNGRAVGTGTMETTYFGTSTVWGRGSGSGPWIMADLEAGLFSGYDAKLNAGDPAIDSWRFVTAVVDGGGGNKWDLRGGDAQKGGLTTFYSGVRPGSRTGNSYYPMHKQGGILLGTGGDNGNGSAGTFYEGVMTVGFPAEATTNAVQANIVAAKYDVQRLGLSRVRTFTPRSKQEVTATFTNTTGGAVTGLRLSVAPPRGWKSAVSGGVATIAGPVEAGASVKATFEISSPAATGAGFLTGRAEWSGSGARAREFETASARVRNVVAVKVNEVRFGTPGNQTNQFIELYNASDREVDLSNWSVIHTQSQWTPVKLVSIPAGTRLAAGGFYLLGLASSGLAAPVKAGETVINVRSTLGFEAGQKIDIDGEMRTVKSAGGAASPMTVVFEQVSTEPWLKFPAGSANLPVANAAGFEVGQKIGIDAGGNYEVATVTAVGKAATQTTLAAAVGAGATNIKIAALLSLTPGDELVVGTGARKESVKVKIVGTAGANGTGVDVEPGLKFDHATGIDVSDRGTGISFTPGTKFAHMSGDAVQALGSGITLESPLAKAHGYGAPVVNAVAAGAGYQGSPAPQQWFGGALSARAGSIALMDAGGVLVDGMVYGSQQSNSSANGTIASPEIATLEGDQHQGGCIVVVPGPMGSADRSRGRFPDGADKDSLCEDFLLQPSAVLSGAVVAGANNIKVSSVAGFGAGQTITVDAGANAETAVIASVGTAGGTTVTVAAAAGATVIRVGGVAGFAAGQTITIDGGGNRETAVVAAVAGGRGGASITLASPLGQAHGVGAEVAGSGIGLVGGLVRGHGVGVEVGTGGATPGAANRFDVRGRSTLAP